MMVSLISILSPDFSISILSPDFSDFIMKSDRHTVTEIINYFLAGKTQILHGMNAQ